MGPGRGGVHERGADRSVLIALFHLALYIFVAEHWVLRQPLYEHSHRLALADLEPPLWPQVGVDQQVLGPLVVDLQHRHCDLKRGEQGRPYLIFFVFGRFGLDAPEDFIAGDGDDALVGSVADHGVGLAGACLSVREQTAVVALPRVVQYLLPELRKWRLPRCTRSAGPHICH